MSPRTNRVVVFLDDPPRAVDVRVDDADAQVAARYAEWTRQLAEGTIRPKWFRAQVATWEPVAGLRLLADPEAVLALIEQERAGE